MRTGSSTSLSILLLCLFMLCIYYRSQCLSVLSVSGQGRVTTSIYMLLMDVFVCGVNAFNVIYSREPHMYVDTYTLYCSIHILLKKTFANRFRKLFTWWLLKYFSHADNFCLGGLFCFCQWDQPLRTKWQLLIYGSVYKQ